MQGIAGVGRIEQDQGQIGFVEEQGVDQPVIRLTGQVPQHGLTLSAIAACPAEFVQQPELLAVRGSMFFELAVGHPPAEPGLSNPRVAHQHDPGAGVADRRRSEAQESLDVQFPDVDHAVAFTLWRSGIRTHRGEPGLAGMEAESGRPFAGCRFRDHGQADARLGAPEADGKIRRGTF